MIVRQKVHLLADFYNVKLYTIFAFKTTLFAKFVEKLRLKTGRPTKNRPFSKGVPFEKPLNWSVYNEE